jgi:hypothetical protein
MVQMMCTVGAEIIPYRAARTVRAYDTVATTARKTAITIFIMVNRKRQEEDNDQQERQDNNAQTHKEREGARQ